MSTQHTPGPWTVVCDPCHFHSMSDVVGGQVRTKGPIPHQMHVAVGGHCSIDEQEANARLIAAAPELLEALEQCVEWLDLLKQNYPDMAGLIRGLEAGRVAVSKAKGQP